MTACQRHWVPGTSPGTTACVRIDQEAPAWRRCWRIYSWLSAEGVAATPRAASIAATSIFFMPNIASNARFASSPPAAIASVSTRGVICQEIPHLSLRSEEHTSELQSLMRISYAVFCLKKKTQSTHRRSHDGHSHLASLAHTT